jgi:hypothetical protein
LYPSGKGGELFRWELYEHLVSISPNFWLTRKQIVSKESATFGLGGSQEHVVRLDADHHRICKFNPQDETDINNYAIVEANFLRLYLEILEERGAQIAANRRGLLSNPTSSQMTRKYPFSIIPTYHEVKQVFHITKLSIRR